jgi:myo-inositol-1(or 4)-monophosphatase
MLDTLSPILTEAAIQSLAFFDSLTTRQIESKSPGDLVSDADRAVEQTLRQRLTAAFPDCNILGEEFGGAPTDRYWAIDSIDGTKNFLSGLPFWTVSLGLVQGGQPVVGAITAPALGLSVIGAIGQPLRTTGLTPGSRPEDPPCVGLGRNPRWPAADRYTVEAQADAHGLGVRLIGSCALSLMLVATGRLKGYIDARVGGLWDCAGGLALCRAAGLPTSFKVHPDGSVDVLAGEIFAIADAVGWRGEILKKS